MTYEEKWMVYYAFQSFERHKADSSVIVVEDPYAVTSSYIAWVYDLAQIESSNFFIFNELWDIESVP